MNGLALVRADILNVKDANGVVTDKKDKNGLPAIILSPVAGTIPSKRTISGTIAQRQQIFEGSTYLVQFTELPEDPENGRQFQFSNLSGAAGASALDVIKASKELGEIDIVEVK